MSTVRFALTLTAVTFTFVACSSFDGAPEKAASSSDGDAGSETSTGLSDAGKGISLQLTDATKTAYLIQGEDLELAFEVQREAGSTGPVAVKVASGLPANVASTPVVVPAGETKGRLLLRSDARVRQGAASIEVTAQAEDGATASAKRTVFVRGKSGTLDTTFDENGIVAAVWPSPEVGHVDDVAAGDDGSVLVSGARGTPDSFPALVALDPTGTRDVKFEGGGAISVSSSQGGTAVAVHSPSSSLKGAIDVMSSEASTTFVHRYDAGGKPLAEFNGGVATATVPGLQTPWGQQIAALADGSLLLFAAYETPAVYAVSRWTRAGTIDSTYGAGGACIINPQTFGGTGGSHGRMLVAADGSLRVVLADGSAGTTAVATCTAKGIYASAATKVLGLDIKLADAATTPDGGLVVLSHTDDSESLEWRRYSPTLELDTKIGSGGVIAVGLGNSPYGAVLVQPNGRVTVANGVGAAIKVRQHLPNGSIDMAFGVGGTLTIPLSGVGNADVKKLVRHKDGRIVVLESSGAVARFWP